MGIGKVDKVDIVASKSRGEDCLRVYIHLSYITPIGERLRAKLVENEARQKEGELVAPVKIATLYQVGKLELPNRYRVYISTCLIY